MDVHAEHAYYYQRLVPRTFTGPNVLWPPCSLKLLSNRTVSFDGGPPHGRWGFNTTRSELCITFHWQGQQDRALEHEFAVVANTNCFVLTRAHGIVRPNAILIPQTEAPLASQLPEQLSLRDGSGFGPKRRRTSR